MCLFHTSCLREWCSDCSGCLEVQYTVQYKFIQEKQIKIGMEKLRGNTGQD